MPSSTSRHGHREDRPASNTRFQLIAAAILIVVCAASVALSWKLMTQNDPGTQAPPQWHAPYSSPAAATDWDTDELRELYGQVRRADAAVDTAAGVVAADPLSDTPVDRLDEAEQICKDLVRQYNDAASADPENLDGLPTEAGQDPGNDCTASSSPTPNE
jgi:hypothetical protein